MGVSLPDALSTTPAELLDQTQCAEELRPIRLTDYRPPDWLIETVDLNVSLDPIETRIHAKLKIRPNSAGLPVPLVLDGDELKLVSLALDGEPLPAESFAATPDRLTIAQPPHRVKISGPV